MVDALGQTLRQLAADVARLGVDTLHLDAGEHGPRRPLLVPVLASVPVDATLVLIGTDQPDTPQAARFRANDTGPLIGVVAALDPAELAAASKLNGPRRLVALTVESPVDVVAIVDELLASRRLTSILRGADRVRFVYGGGPPPLQLATAMVVHARAASVVRQTRIDDDPQAGTVLRTAALSLGSRLVPAGAVEAIVQAARYTIRARGDADPIARALLSRVATAPADVLVTLDRAAADAMRARDARDLVVDDAVLDAALPDDRSELAEVQPDERRVAARLAAALHAARHGRWLDAAELIHATGEAERDVLAVEPARLADAVLALAARRRLDGAVRSLERWLGECDGEVARLLDELIDRPPRVDRMGGRLCVLLPVGNLDRAASEPIPTAVRALLRESADDIENADLVLLGTRQPGGDERDTADTAHRLGAALREEDWRARVVELTVAPTATDAIVSILLPIVIGAREVAVLHHGGAATIPHAALIAAATVGVELTYRRTLPTEPSVVSVDLGAVVERVRDLSTLRAAASVLRTGAEADGLAALALVSGRYDLVSTAHGAARLHHGQTDDQRGQARAEIAAGRALRARYRLTHLGYASLRASAALDDEALAAALRTAGEGEEASPAAAIVAAVAERMDEG